MSLALSLLAASGTLARGLGVDGKTIARYLDLLVDLLLVRRLQAWHSNVGKRLVRSPKVLVRDAGLVHALLGLTSREQLLGHPVVGHSWEGFVTETLLELAPVGTEASFYRTSAGAEIDLVLSLPGGELWAIEIKRSSAPTIEKGFHFACADLKPARQFIVYSGEERFPLGPERKRSGFEGWRNYCGKQLDELLRNPADTAYGVVLPHEPTFRRWDGGNLTEATADVDHFSAVQIAAVIEAASSSKAI